MKQPLIMIAHGTGIAPFVSITDRIKNVIEQGNSIGNIYLIYGVRNEGDEFYYKDALIGLF